MQCGYTIEPLSSFVGVLTLSTHLLRSHLKKKGSAKTFLFWSKMTLEIWFNESYRFEFIGFNLIQMDIPIRLFHELSLIHGLRSYDPAWMSYASDTTPPSYPEACNFTFRESTTGGGNSMTAALRGRAPTWSVLPLLSTRHCVQTPSLVHSRQRCGSQAYITFLDRVVFH